MTVVDHDQAPGDDGAMSLAELAELGTDALLALTVDRLGQIGDTLDAVLELLDEAKAVALSFGQDGPSAGAGGLGPMLKLLGPLLGR